MLQLLRWNYHYIPVNAELLMYSAKKDGYRSGGDFELALEELGRGETTIISLAQVTTAFLARVWVSPIPAIMKQFVLRRVLRVITKHHSRSETLNAFMDHLHATFTSETFLRILNQIRSWEEAMYSADIQINNDQAASQKAPAGRDQRSLGNVA
jgi:hypothetical protein